ncbi:hypothetical protein OG728_38405 (plasmid) [Streptomyces microflavus]|uniref:hypothetical protein n=1 Tax=Streptomyces microflavus TaxID=1919 RepID=UPI002E163D79|nr:hypothetical protein OG728_38405 [Streptomyces microflavus]
MKTAHLITAARRALATLHASEETIQTLTITTTHDPARRTLIYDSECVIARHSGNTVTHIDLGGTDFAEDLDALAEDAMARSGTLHPLTLRLGAGSTTVPPIGLDPQERLFVLSIHARAAAHRPGLTGIQVLTLANLAYEANDAARHDNTPTTAQIESYAGRAGAHKLPFGTVADAEFLTHTARLAVRTMSHYMRPCPLALELPAGYLADIPSWLAHQAVARFRDGEERRETGYNTPAFRAVLRALAALQTPATGDRLSLYLTDAPANSAGHVLHRDPIPEGVPV